MSQALEHWLLQAATVSPCLLPLGSLEVEERSRLHGNQKGRAAPPAWGLESVFSSEGGARNERPSSARAPPGKSILVASAMSSSGPFAGLVFLLQAYLKAWR